MSTAICLAYGATSPVGMTYLSLGAGAAIGGAVVVMVDGAPSQLDETTVVVVVAIAA